MHTNKQKLNTILMMGIAVASLFITPDLNAQDFNTFSACSVRARSALFLPPNFAAFLCRGSDSSVEPTLCVQLARYQITWANSLDPIRLCSGTSDARERISCFHDSRAHRYSTFEGIMACGGRFNW